MDDIILAIIGGVFIGIGSVIVNLSTKDIFALYFFIIGIYFLIQAVL